MRLLALPSAIFLCACSTPATSGKSTPPSVAPGAPGGQAAHIYTWDDLRIQYPTTWYLHDYNIVSHGPGQFGPFLANRALTDPCATSQTDQGVEFSCPNSPVSAPLSSGGGYAQWTASTELGPSDTRDLRHGFGSPRFAAIRATSDCRRSGGTKTITATIVATTRTRYTLRGCVNSTQVSAFERGFRRVAATAEPTG
jgi:hypothetical protein